MTASQGGSTDLEAEEVRISANLAARVAAILNPYREGSGPAGFRAVVAAEAIDILAMQYSREELAESVAAYRRKAEDQNSLAIVAMDALVAAERFRAVPSHVLSDAIRNATTVVNGGGRKPFELERATRAIQRLYPDGVPSQRDLSHAALERAVTGVCVADRLKPPSRETVIRARKQLRTG